MEIKEMQKEVDDWITSFEIGYFSPLSMLACLSEEVGEIARVLNHAYGQKKKKPEELHDSLEGELGDAMYAIICIANAHKIDLGKAFTKTISKYKDRDKKRYT